MKSLIHCLLAFVLLLMGSPAAWQARAQALPPNGPPLHEVARLAKAPEPPGGLIPYRAGELWGYADTTGRVVIQRPR